MMIKKEFRDILGRVIGVDDILIYCSPFDGLHTLIVTLEDPDGTLYVSQVKTDGVYDGKEWLNLLDSPRPFKKYVRDGEDENGEPKYKIVDTVPPIKNLRMSIKVDRNCYPITLYSRYIKMEPIDEEQVIGISLAERIC